jgi:hypothetical protein
MPARERVLLVVASFFALSLELMVSKRKADGNDLEPEICLRATQCERIVAPMACKRRVPAAGAPGGRWNSIFSVFLLVVIRVPFTVNRNLGRP